MVRRTTYAGYPGSTTGADTCGNGWEEEAEPRCPELVSGQIDLSGTFQEQGAVRIAEPVH